LHTIFFTILRTHMRYPHDRDQWTPVGG